MKTNKKTLVILAAIAALCLAGVAVSQFVDWNVDSESTGGNIGKSSRFSRKTAKDGASNMEELLQNDPEFKDGIVAAYLVMKTRAQQFNALVDMSVDVAGDIPAFETVLQAMKDVQPKIVNVCASLEAAGNDLNAALGGETPKDLAQNTNNAALAYGILQQQNSLADDFIDTTDAYLKTAAGDDRCVPEDGRRRRPPQVRPRPVGAIPAVDGRFGAGCGRYRRPGREGLSALARNVRLDLEILQ